MSLYGRLIYLRNKEEEEESPAPWESDLRPHVLPLLRNNRCPFLENLLSDLKPFLIIIVFPQENMNQAAISLLFVFEYLFDLRWSGRINLL